MGFFIGGGYRVALVFVLELDFDLPAKVPGQDATCATGDLHSVLFDLLGQDVVPKLHSATRQ